MYTRVQHVTDRNTGTVTHGLSSHEALWDCDPNRRTVVDWDDWTEDDARVGDLTMLEAHDLSLSHRGFIVKK